MRIYRFHNGDTCPCCGQVISGKTEEELAEFSTVVFGFATALGLADWILRPGPDAIELGPEELRETLKPFAGGDG